MRQEKQVNWRKYLLVLLITVSIFLFGLMVGSWTSTQKLQVVRTLQDDLRTQTLDFETQYALVQEDPCNFGNMTPLIDELYELSVRLDFMERLLGPDDERVVSLKGYYSLLQIRHFLFLQRIQKECGTNQTLILYFYSNKDGECPKCDEQGFILTWLRKNYPQVQIFSFDKNIKLNTLDTIKRRYGIDEVPFIVMDGTVMPGFQSQNALLLAVLNKTKMNQKTVEEIVLEE